MNNEPPEELSHLFDRLARDGMSAGVYRGPDYSGCPVRCEVDTHTAAALIAAQDLAFRDLKKQGIEPPADPLGLVPMVLQTWAEEVWKSGRVGPEHHEQAVQLARARAESSDRADEP
jgi:hypothetical protein